MEASVVADPCEMVEPVEKQRAMPGWAPRAGRGRESAAGEALREMAGLDDAAILTSEAAWRLLSLAVDGLRFVCWGGI